MAFGIVRPNTEPAFIIGMRWKAILLLAVPVATAKYEIKNIVAYMPTNPSTKLNTEKGKWTVRESRLVEKRSWPDRLNSHP